MAELNKVPGFDPLKFLRHKVSRKTNEEMLQLELPYQKLWFRLRHPQGRMKLTTLRITEQLAIMEARVYLDRSDAEPISSYISQHSAEEGTDYVQAAQDEALSAALSDAGFGLQFADVAVDSTGKVFGSSIPLSGTAPIQQPMTNAAQRPVEAPGAALRQSGVEVHARPERAPQNAVEGRNAPARPAPIQKPAAKPVQNEQPPVSPVQPVVQQMVAEEKENMDTLPAGKVEENAPNMELLVPSREVTLDSSPKQDDASEQPAASVFQSDELEELPVAPVVQQEAPNQPLAPSYTESTPVEDILKVMTFEEAQNVVVDSGLSKGKTMATVAKERPVSLKFYLTQQARDQQISFVLRRRSCSMVWPHRKPDDKQPIYGAKKGGRTDGLISRRFSVRYYGCSGTSTSTNQTPTGKQCICGLPVLCDRRGKMNVNFVKNVWRCNYCDEHGGMLALYARLNNTTTSDAYWEIGEALCNDFHRERPNSGYEMAGNQQAGTGSPVSGTQTDLVGYERRGELKTVQQAERASGQEIHQTLSLLLAMLPLQPAHRNHLHSPRNGTVG